MSTGCRCARSTNWGPAPGLPTRRPTLPSAALLHAARHLRSYATTADADVNSNDEHQHRWWRRRRRSAVDLPSVELPRHRHPVLASSYQPVQQIFQPLAANRSLNRVWRFFDRTKNWLFYDPRPEFARFNTLRTVNVAAETPAILFVSVDRRQQFRGYTLYPGWNHCAHRGHAAVPVGSERTDSRPAVPSAGPGRDAGQGVVAESPERRSGSCTTPTRPLPRSTACTR